MDARGELDFQLVRYRRARPRRSTGDDTQDLGQILRHVEGLQSAEVTPINGGNTEAMLEEYHTRTRNTFVGAVAPITVALERTHQTCNPLPVSLVASNIAAQSFICVC